MTNSPDTFVILSPAYARSTTFGRVLTACSARNLNVRIVSDRSNLVVSPDSIAADMVGIFIEPDDKLARPPAFIPWAAVRAAEGVFEQPTRMSRDVRSGAFQSGQGNQQVNHFG